MTLLACVATEDYVLVGADGRQTVLSGKSLEGHTDAHTVEVDKFHKVEGKKLAWGVVNDVSAERCLESWLTEEADEDQDWPEFCSDLSVACGTLRKTQRLNVLGDLGIDPKEDPLQALNIPGFDLVVGGFVGGVGGVVVEPDVSSPYLFLENGEPHFFGPFSATAHVAWKAFEAASTAPVSMADPETFKKVLRAICGNTRDLWLPEKAWMLKRNGEFGSV